MTSVMTLPHGITATVTDTLSVRLSGNTYPNKDTIKACGFRWQNRTWCGEKTALDLLTARLGHHASAEKFPPTTQQNKILAAITTGKTVVVEALAGTGKTATCELIARQDPTRRILLVVFNKTAQLDAQKRMPSNVECRTLDSLGWAAAPGGMTDKFKAQTSAAPRSVSAPLRKIREIGEFLNLDTNPVEITETVLDKTGKPTEKVTALSIARAVTLAQQAIERFCQSADSEISIAHIDNSASELLREAIVKLAHRMWADITSPTGRLRVTNAHLTKAWALTKPDLSTPGSGPRHVPSLILVDEAQDTGPVTEALIRAQSIQTVWLGDSNQMIYEWRGCTNSLANVQVDEGMRLPLTQSWRFGPQIAYEGNLFLRLLKCNWEIQGSGSVGIVGTVTAPDAVICRTNAGVIGQIIELLGNGHLVAVPKGMRADLAALVATIMWLQGGPVPHRIHDDLAAYGSWGELITAIENGETDGRVEKLVDLVELHGVEGLDAVVNGLSEDTTSGQKIIVTTAHKSKGLQFDSVRIAEDFRRPRYNNKGQIMTIPDNSELRLSYVAITRARKEIDLGGLDWARDAITAGY